MDPPQDTPAPKEPSPPAEGARYEVEYVLVFDGGALNNPGRGYGSYRWWAVDRGRWTVDHGPPSTVLGGRRLDFGDGVTNNEAEYRALIAGLEDLLASLPAAGHLPERVQVRIAGDSRLVINQLMGGWRVRSPGLRPLHARARELVDRFGEVSARWHPRARSVAILGH